MHRIGLGIIFALLLLAGAFFGLYGVSFAVDGIIPGVRVGQIDLGGLTGEDAERKLNELASKIETMTVKVNYGAKNDEIPAGELGIKMDVATTLGKAEQAGNTGSIFNRLAERQRVKHHGLNIKPVLIPDRKQLEGKVEQVWKNANVEPENAGFKVLPDDRVAIVPGRMGSRIDIDALEKDIIEKIIDHHTDHIEVRLPVLTVEPLRTTQDIESMEINGLIAQYSTQFDSSQAGRTYNIKVAAAALDGLLIAPGDEFSFNRVVGPRSSEAGYKNANVIINNELVEGLGGGVCQVSSTLYNAVLMANLKIVERNNHSLPVSYVPIGRDATVVYDAVDFKFTNNTDFYIYLRSIVSGNKLTIKLYGNKAKTPQVELASWVLQKIEPTVTYEKDPNLAEGEKVVKQEGTNGFKAAAVRYIWKDGEKVEETLPSSFYRPMQRIVAIGTGEASPTVVVPLDQDLKPPVINQPIPLELETPALGEGEEELVPAEREEGENGTLPDDDGDNKGPVELPPAFAEQEGNEQKNQSESDDNNPDTSDTEKKFKQDTELPGTDPKGDNAQLN